jgi:hypothetical protein
MENCLEKIDRNFGNDNCERHSAVKVRVKVKPEQITFRQGIRK